MLCTEISTCRQTVRKSEKYIWGSCNEMELKRLYFIAVASQCSRTFLTFLWSASAISERWRSSYSFYFLGTAFWRTVFTSPWKACNLWCHVTPPAIPILWSASTCYQTVPNAPGASLACSREPWTERSTRRSSTLSVSTSCETWR